jgi:IS30 family transposase
MHSTGTTVPPAGSYGTADPESQPALAQPLPQKVLHLEYGSKDWLRAIPVASRKSQEVAQAVVQALQDIPPHLRKTITFDNGSEFADHDVIAQQLNVDIYFARPYSAYERGRNENANGLLRQYIPKGMSFKSIPLEQLEAIVNQLNDRPRKKQQFRTPHEVFKQQRTCLTCS